MGNLSKTITYDSHKTRLRGDSEAKTTEVYEKPINVNYIGFLQDEIDKWLASKDEWSIRKTYQNRIKK